MSETTIEKTVFLGVPIEAAWGFLTEAKKLEPWLFKTDADFELGAAYTLHSREEEGAKRCWGEVLEMDAPHRLRQ